MDDTVFATKVIGSLVIGAYMIFVWVIKTALGNKEAIVLLKAEAASERQRFLDFRSDVEKGAKDQMKADDVRKVVEELLDRRDRAVIERRKDYDQIHEALVRRVVSEELIRFRRDLRAEFNLRRSQGAGPAIPLPRPATREGDE